MRLLRSLFYNMALGKFLDVQAAFGASGLHAKLVDASLDLLRGPSATPAQVLQACWGMFPCILASGGLDYTTILYCHVKTVLLCIQQSTAMPTQTPVFRPLHRCRRSWQQSFACLRQLGWSTSSLPCRA